LTIHEPRGGKEKSGKEIEKRFSEEFLEYKRKVMKWIPG